MLKQVSYRWLMSSNWYKRTQGKTTTERGYGHAWRKVREIRLKMDKYLCVPCKQQGRYTKATEVDHIIEKANGGTDEYDNLQSICATCHKAKTSGKQIKACGVDGMPLDPNHPWNVCST